MKKAGFKITYAVWTQFRVKTGKGICKMLMAVFASGRLGYRSFMKVTPNYMIKLIIL